MFTDLGRCRTSVLFDFGSVQRTIGVRVILKKIALRKTLGFVIFFWNCGFEHLFSVICGDMFFLLFEKKKLKNKLLSTFIRLDLWCSYPKSFFPATLSTPGTFDRIFFCEFILWFGDKLVAPLFWVQSFKTTQIFNRWTFIPNIRAKLV